MDELKVFFRSLDAGVVYLSLILVMLLAIKIKLARVSYLVVGGCSVPLSFYCFFYWIYGAGGDMWAPVMLVIEALAFAQLGWLGGILFLLGVVLKKDYLKMCGLWVSISSIVAHGLFLGNIIFLWDGS
ncbi:hypothetical protein [Pseudomonas marginalis]|uniref:Uncharacterized protein n=1 Tax=Pseudomonas marginalis TaxID=298 RepID=A0A9X5QLZ1_PSEMA|nr:hypothetical protein [Pseudomonas marginalis]OAJ50919.1 hypothetical protein AO064_08700 [Pseudomonas marginalis]